MSLIIAELVNGFSKDIGFYNGAGYLSWPFFYFSLIVATLIKNAGF
jgi:hypothetical protein